MGFVRTKELVPPWVLPDQIADHLSQWVSVFLLRGARHVHAHRVFLDVREQQILAQHSTVGVRVAAHAPFSTWG